MDIRFYLNLNHGPASASFYEVMAAAAQRQHLAIGYMRCCDDPPKGNSPHASSPNTPGSRGKHSTRVRRVSRRLSSASEASLGVGEHAGRPASETDSGRQEETVLNPRQKGVKLQWQLGDRVIVICRAAAARAIRPMTPSLQ